MQYERTYCFNQYMCRHHFHVRYRVLNEVQYGPKKVVEPRICLNQPHPSALSARAPSRQHFRLVRASLAPPAILTRFI